MNDFVLRPWQKVIVDYLEDYPELANSELLLSFSDYDRNRALAVQVAMPSGMGHTTLAAYIAVKFPTVLVYRSLDDYKEIEQIASTFESSPMGFNFNMHTKCISTAEIFYDMVTVSKSQYQSDALEKLRVKFGNNDIEYKVTLVDQGLSVLTKDTEIVDWLFQVSTGPVVFLGR